MYSHRVKRFLCHSGAVRGEEGLTTVVVYTHTAQTHGQYHRGHTSMPAGLEGDGEQETVLTSEATGA